ncbi:MAG TPA: SRPBCC family protein [Acidimicrobiales bacterium]|nr:SRPBCC family protein [Acidimicrobiales bacterium]
MTKTAASPDGTLERTADGGIIRFERHLPYPVEAVWDAITNPERLADWWLPFDADITVELHEGGEMVFAATSGEPPPMTCIVLRVQPPVLFEHTAFVDGATLRWELEAVPEGTVLRLHEHVPSVDQAIEGGWLVGLHLSFSRLEPAIAGAPVPWDWDALAVAWARYAERGLAIPGAAPRP